MSLSKPDWPPDTDNPFLTGFGAKRVAAAEVDPPKVFVRDIGLSSVDISNQNTPLPPSIRQQVSSASAEAKSLLAEMDESKEQDEYGGNGPQAGGGRFTSGQARRILNIQSIPEGRVLNKKTRWDQKCYNCHQPGHYASECNKRSSSFFNEGFMLPSNYSTGNPRPVKTTVTTTTTTTPAPAFIGPIRPKYYIPRSVPRAPTIFERLRVRPYDAHRGAEAFQKVWRGWRAARDWRRAAFRRKRGLD